MFRIRGLFPFLVIAALFLSACGPTTTLPGSPPTITASPPTAAITVTALAATAAPQAASTAAAQPVETDTMAWKFFDFTSQALAANLLGDSATRRISVLKFSYALQRLEKAHRDD